MEYKKFLSLTEKEDLVFSYLLEYGNSAASEIARHISLPKSSVNFISDNLWKRGFLKKTFRGKTGYYEINLENIQEIFETEIQQKQYFIGEILPKLQEKTRKNTLRPTIEFIDGEENCKKAYKQLLNVKKFYEIGAHSDLVKAFGEKFMNDFIAKRIEKGVFCDSIGTDEEIEKNLHKKDTEQLRNLKLIEKNQGRISSSIAIYDNKVLILNLTSTIPTGVLIGDPSFAQTMKTFYQVAKNNV